jgi:hypothetical protein
LLRTTRPQLATKFEIMIHQIQQYIVHHNADDWKRSLVCGIIWFDDEIVICTRQLCKLIKKCKASINFAFQSLGYVTVTMTSERVYALSCVLPVFTRGGGGIRQWTVRARQDKVGNYEKQSQGGYHGGWMPEAAEVMDGIESRPDEFMFRDDGDDLGEFTFNAFDL